MPHVLKFRLPAYVTPRNAWRKLIHCEALAVAREKGITYGAKDKLAVEVKLYLRGRALEVHDVDNRLKDILDALQGRAGGNKMVRRLRRIIRNDHQVYRVTITKLAPPKQSRGLGHVAVKLLRQ